jgi:hypothetical protein
MQMPRNEIQARMLQAWTCRAGTGGLENIVTALGRETTRRDRGVGWHVVFHGI